MNLLGNIAFTMMVAIPVLMVAVLLIELLLRHIFCPTAGSILYKEAEQLAFGHYKIKVVYRRSWLSRIIWKHKESATETFIGDGNSWYSTKTHHKPNISLECDLTDAYHKFSERDLQLEQERLLWIGGHWQYHKPSEGKQCTN